MNAKDFLNQAYLLDQQIKSKSEQIQSLNELATSCTATMTGMPHNPNRGTSRMADAVCKIIDLQIEALNQRLEDKQMHVTVSTEAKQFIIDAAYDPQFGARPLRRYVQHTVETLLARRLLEGSILPGQTLAVDVENGELVIRAEKA